MDVSLGRAPEPESTDGEVGSFCEFVHMADRQIYTMAVPNFLSIEPEDFNPETYVAPPFSSAATSLCWRYDPIDGKTLQSNARMVRWSDGSLTLQLASNPKDHYRVTPNRLARSHKTTSADYNSDLDSHMYLGAAAEAASAIRLTSHLTASLAITPTTIETDDAVLRLRDSLAAAARSGANKNPDGTVTMLDITEDPELAKKQAELAEREKLREARKRQAAADREMDRGRRVGLHTRTGGSGLTVAGLEDDSDLAGAKGSAARARKTKQRANKRGEIYSDEESGPRRGRGREDEYEEDDFLVGSDEEPEVYDDEEEEDADMGDGGGGSGGDGESNEEEEQPQRSREPRERPQRESQGRKKNRYTVADEDEDEDEE